MSHPFRKVRASSLPEFDDCARRWAAKQPRLVPRSYKIRSRAPHIGGIIGSAVHAGAALLYNGLIADGSLARARAEVIDLVTEATLERIRDAGEIEYGSDGRTPHQDAAVWAAQSLTVAYAATIDEAEQPAIAPEHALAIRITPLRLDLTGHLDIFMADRIGEDLKTSPRVGNHGPQFGSYHWQLRTNGFDPAPKFREKNLARPKFPGGRKPPLARVEPKVRVFDAAALEAVALSSAKNIARSLDAWEASGDPDSFPANPSSHLCSEKYCPAYGTEWCQVWKLKEPR